MVAALPAMLALSHKQLALVLGAIVGLLEVILAIPLALKKVKPNRVYGLATYDTIHDRDVWYKANRYFGVAVIVSGIVTLAGTGVAFAMKGGNSPRSIELIVAAAIVVPAIVALGLSLYHLRKL